MLLLGLDLSTRTGWSTLRDGRLETYGLIHTELQGGSDSPEYPHNYITCSRSIGSSIAGIYMRLRPDVVVIEETNKGKNRYSQKLLEFIHYSTNSYLKEVMTLENHFVPVVYMDTSAWRKAVGLERTEEEKKINHQINKDKSSRYKDLYLSAVHHLDGCLVKGLEQCVTKREQKKYVKEHIQDIKDLVKEMLHNSRVRIEGELVTKVSLKDASVRLVNSLFSTEFKRKDNDICDSILLALGYYKTRCLTP